MVWFHGGGFVTGSSDSNFYGPGNLLDRDVILVTANYRLGVLGFLTLGKPGEDHDIQGNQGLWDQIEGNQDMFEVA
jgi:carboxylesterase type B